MSIETIRQIAENCLYGNWSDAEAAFKQLKISSEELLASLEFLEEEFPSIWRDFALLGYMSRKEA